MVCIASLIVSCPFSPFFCLPTVPQPQKAPHGHHARLLFLLFLGQPQQQQALRESPHVFRVLHPFGSPLLAALSQPLPLLEIKRSGGCLFGPSFFSSSPPSSRVWSVLLFLRGNGYPPLPKFFRAFPQGFPGEPPPPPPRFNLFDLALKGFCSLLWVPPRWRPMYRPAARLSRRSELPPLAAPRHHLRLMQMWIRCT